MRFCVLISVFCVLSSFTAHAQWLETTIPLPDSQIGISAPNLLALDPANDLIYVCGTTSGTIYPLDGFTGRKGGRITPPNGVAELCYASQENKLYCRGGGMSGASLTVIDAASGRIIGTIPLPDYSARLCYNPVEHKVYSAGDGSVSVIDAQRDSVIATVQMVYPPGALCWDGVGNKVYAVCRFSGYMRAIDGAGDTLIDSVYVSEEPRQLLYNPISNKVYSPDESYWDLGIVDARADTVIRWLWLYGSGYRMCLNTRDNKVYVANQGLNMLHVVGGYDDSMHAELALNGTPTDCIYDSLDDLVYVTCPNTDSIFAVDGATDQIVARFGLLAGPSALCLDPAQRRLYSANSADGDVAIIHVPENRLEQRVPFWFGPGAACDYPQSDAICFGSPDVCKVIILDATTNRPRSLLNVPAPVSSVLNAASLGKVYCGSADGLDSTMSVIDPGRDTVLKSFRVARGAAPVAFRTQGAPKVYAISSNDTVLSVIDAQTDTVIARRRFSTGFPSAIYDSLDDRLFVMSANSTLLAISGRTDSLVGQLPFTWTAYDFCYVPAHDDVCTTVSYPFLIVVDAATLAVVEVPLPASATKVAYCDREDKVYCLLNDTLLAAVSMPLHQVVDFARVPYGITGMVYDDMANQLYCFDDTSSSVIVVNCHTDVVDTTMTVGPGINGWAWSPLHRRFYLTEERTSSVAVLADTSAVGVAEANPHGIARASDIPTIVRGVLRINPQFAANSSRLDLYDINGRRVLDVRLPGAGTRSPIPVSVDVSRLAPGVYFLRSVAGDQRSEVSKVLILK